MAWSRSSTGQVSRGHAGSCLTNHSSRRLRRGLTQGVRPHMQTRDVLWKRTIQSQLGAAAAIALILFGLSFLPEDFSRLFWMPIAGLAFAITYVALLGRIKCPRCDYPFLNCGIYRIKLGSIKYRINHCPHCGTSLDSEWGPNQSFKPTPSARLNSRR